MRCFPALKLRYIKHNNSVWRSISSQTDMWPMNTANFKELKLYYRYQDICAFPESDKSSRNP